MIHHILSFILGGFIIGCVFFGVFWLLTAVETVEEKVKNTKSYKIASFISTLLLFGFGLAFSLFSCWALGDWIIRLVG